MIERLVLMVYSMMNIKLDQTYRIWNEDWRYLIILDACRYDFFAKVYRDYQILKSGTLEKVTSAGSATIEWFEKTFINPSYGERRPNDLIVYVSANPFINSRKYSRKGYLKIIDVWDWGWSRELGTVHPKEVNKAVLIATRLYRKASRYVVHYMQPHYPYIGLANLRKIFLKTLAEESSRRSIRTLNNRIKGFIRWKLIKMLGPLGLRLASRLVGPPLSIEFAVAKHVGKEGLRKAYEENLRLVLEYVSKLIVKLHGIIVITADHGELLGEYGAYGHFAMLRVPELIEVPWMVIER
jgi:hypothetical protein